MHRDGDTLVLDEHARRYGAFSRERHLGDHRSPAFAFWVLPVNPSDTAFQPVETGKTDRRVKEGLEKPERPTGDHADYR